MWSTFEKKSKSTCEPFWGCYELSPNAESAVSEFQAFLGLVLLILPLRAQSQLSLLQSSPRYTKYTILFWYAVDLADYAQATVVD